MQIYHYDPQSRLFTDVGEADPNPLVLHEWLMPAHATDVAPPPCAQDERARFDPSTRSWEVIAVPKPTPTHHYGEAHAMSRQPTNEDRHVYFDRRISLSDILIALSMLVAGFAAYSNLDKRVAVGEAQQALLAQQTANQQAEQKAAINDLRTDVKDIQRSLNELIRTSIPKQLTK